MTPRLFLLDAYALIYRAYYALMRAQFNSSVGFNTGAIYGFNNTLDELLRKERPTHIAVCFDPPHGRTFRHEKFEAYKAQRDKQPEDITLSIPYIKRILAARRIPVIEVEGYEADDVIGTLATRAAAEGYDVYMMTPDKDYGQLVGDHIYMYRPPLRGEGFEVRDAAKVCERYGISRPEQIIDLLALEGDASDNIPGCPGVGEKTARKLIEEYGSVENLLENTDRLSGKLKERVRDNAEQIRVSKWLATICRDVPVDIAIADLEARQPDFDALAAVYKQLDFKSLLVRLGEQARKAAKDVPDTHAVSAPTENAPAQPDGTGMASLFDIADTDDGTPALPAVETVEYEVADTPEAVAALVACARSAEAVGIAAYAVGADVMSAPLLGMGLKISGEEKAAYIPLPDGDDAARKALLSALAPLFAADGPEIVSHDVKRAYLLLKNEGVDLGRRYFDTSVAHYVIDPEVSHDLGRVAEAKLGIRLAGVEPDAKVVNPKSPLEPEVAALRFAAEADAAMRLRPMLEREVEERGMGSLLREVEFPLVRVLAEMEWTGVRIDPLVLINKSLEMKIRLDEMREQAYKMAGRYFNISSPAQVGEVLFDDLRIDPKAKKTSRGAYSTTEQILEKYAPRVPLVQLILDIRHLSKLVSTYIDALPKLINPRTGKIHTSYNQTVTATGRISSANPNLQNIPVRTDEGRGIRAAFIPERGHRMLSADYSQIELRLIADLSGDREMIDAFLSGEDIHRATAAKIYGVPLDEVTDDQRRHAKTANFGIIYGISAFGLSERLGIARSEAKKLIDGYFATYPHIRAYLDEAVATARSQGYVTTRMGRRRYLPDINSRNAVVRSYAERNAVNAPIQGTAADIIKVAMVRIFDQMEQRGMKSRMIMQVHDELIFDVAPDEAADLRRLVVDGMENAYHGAVPLSVAADFGSNWLEAH